MSYVIEDDTVKINIDKALFDILNSNKTLETVIYSMNLSLEENTNAKEVIYMVDDYIYKKYKEFLLLAFLSNLFLNFYYY